MFWWCNNFFSFAGPTFAIFSKIFRLPSNDLQKDPYINRCTVWNFLVYPALYFYLKYVMQNYADTSSLVLLTFLENVWVNIQIRLL